MHKTFRVLATHLKNNVPEIQWIDRDKGQLEKPENFSSLLPPALLLDFGTVNWKAGSNENQNGICQLTVKLIFGLPPSTHEGAAWNDYLEYEDLSRKVYDACCNTAGIIGDRMESYDHYTGNFYVCEQTFQCKVYQVKEIKIIDKPDPFIAGTLKVTI